MQEKLRYRAKGEQPLLKLNYEETPSFSDDPLLSDEEKEAREDRRTRHFLTSDEDELFQKRVLFERLPDGVLDKQSLRLVQVDDLYRALNYSITNMGAASLYRSLILPPEDPVSIQAKQEAVAELRTHDALRKAVVDYLENFQKMESDLFLFLNDYILNLGLVSGRFIYPYKRLRKILQTFADLPSLSQTVAKAESNYIKNLASVSRGYGKTDARSLMQGPVYKDASKKTLLTQETAKGVWRKSRFYPQYPTPSTAILSSPLAAILGQQYGLHVPLLAELSKYDPSSPLALSVFSIFTLSGVLAFKPAVDYYKFLKPLRDLALKDDAFLDVMDGVGKLDELQSLVRYSQEAGKTITPRIADESHHRFQATELRNPVLGKNNPDFVPNDVDLHGINFITGPNSGGKSTISRTVVQSQLLAQIGSDILAKEATIVPAQKIAYQAPQYDALQDTEGRFGTELKRTRDIFFSIGPLSLVILDELAEGTTSGEKMAVSRTTLEGFHKKGGTTMLVTHNYELVEQFKNEGVGQDLQVEFNGETPTHKIIPGISKVSHADRVAKKVGFDRAAIEKHLKEEGYI